MPLRPKMRAAVGAAIATVALSLGLPARASVVIISNPTNPLLISTPPVATQQGPVTGSIADGVASYLGIPYAAPPLGPLRWVAPQPPAQRTTTLAATSYGSYCPQGLSPIGAGGGNEDCLYLNIQAPASATSRSNLPVVFWIHGGALQYGSGQEYDGSAWVREQNVVFVSINYRLLALGYLAHPALSAENTRGVSGNYGLLDQMAALAWVKANIANFGGNPNRILVYGESAGGNSTINLLLSPLAPAFNAAAIQSGAYARTYQTLANAQTTGQSFAAGLGCTTQDAACIAQLRALPATTIRQASFNPAPNLDGYVLPQQPLTAFAAGNFRRVPIIDGTNLNENRLFISLYELQGITKPYTADNYFSSGAALLGGGAAAEQSVQRLYPLSAFGIPNYAAAAITTDYGMACPAVILDALLSRYVPVYAYELTEPLPPMAFLPPDPNMPSLGTPHAADLFFLFPQYQNRFLGFPPPLSTPSQLRLGRGMRSMWATLLKFGRPLNPTGGVWPRYSLTTHGVLNLRAPAPTMEYNRISAHQCDFWAPPLLSQAGLPADTPY